MTASFMKPNLRGGLLFVSAIIVVFNLFPMPQISYSAMTFRASLAWPWPWALAALGTAVVLYALSMRLGAALPRQDFIRTMTGPLLVIPAGLAVAVFTGFYLYVPPEISGRPEHLLFLQGNTDLGGGCLFAAMVALYVFFGFTAAWQLTLKLQESPAPAPFGKSVLKSLWILKFHLLLFITAAPCLWPYDARVTPNDFRNLSLLAALLYILAILWICALRNLRLAVSVRLALAPLFTVLWLIVGADGNTARAGQIVQAGQDPRPLVRGSRHRVMLAWHRLCDSTLGDLAPPHR